MIVLHKENLIMIDCDDTLVMWDDTFRRPHDDKTMFIDPYDGTNTWLTPHQKHIKLLRDHKARGYAVVVWSANGYKWAEEVVKKLDLEKYVDVVMSKPNKFVDDLPASDVLGVHIYIKENE